MQSAEISILAVSNYLTLASPIWLYLVMDKALSVTGLKKSTATLIAKFDNMPIAAKATP